MHACRYKWLSSAAGQNFGGIYKLQRQGTAFATPEQWLQQLGIYSATQQSAADYMEVSVHTFGCISGYISLMQIGRICSCTFAAAH